MLEREPLAGELYEGELLASLTSVPRAYWSKHSGEREAIDSIIAGALGSTNMPEDLRQSVEALRLRVHS